MNWKKIIAWITIGIAALILIVIVGVAVLLRSQSFHNYVLRTAQQKASESLGTNVQIRDFNLRLSTLTLDVYGVTVSGAEPLANPPLLQVEHAFVDLNIVSLLRRQWYVNAITIDQPVVHVLADAQGRNNLPTPKKSQGGGNTSIFDLGIRHAQLNRGEAYYNDRKSALNADLHDLSFQASFAPATKTYSGTLGYRDGKLQMSNFNPIPHDLQAQFTATQERFTLEQATLTSGDSKVLLKAVATDYSNPRVNGSYDAVIDAGEFRRILKNESVPLGLIRLAGQIEYASKPNTPAVQSVQLAGDMSSKALEMRSAGFRGDIRDLSAKYSLKDGNAAVTDMRAALLGGQLTGTMTMRDITGDSRSHLSAELKGVSVAALKSFVNSPALEQVELNGRVDATTDATWGKTMNDLRARTDAIIQATLAAAQPATPAQPVPLDGVIHATYSAPSKEIALTNSYLRTPQTSVNLNGTVSDRSALLVQVQANDLHELESLANSFRTPTPGQPTPQALGLYGTASFNGSVRGSTNAPQVSGQLVANNLKIHGTQWRVLRTNVSLSPSQASLQNGDLQSAKRGRITFNVQAGLKKWSYTETSPIRVTLNASQMDIGELARTAGVQTPIAGVLAADVNVRGSQLNPIGNGTVTLTNAKVASEPIQAVELRFNGTGDTVHATLNARVPAGAAQATVTYLPKQQSYDAQLTAKGIRLQDLQTVKARNMQLTGVLNVNATGHGTLKNPGLVATAQIPQLTIQKETIRGINLQANVENHLANFTLDSEVVNTFVRARGEVQLTGDYYTDATFDTQNIPLQPLVAAYMPAQATNLSGNTELHATVRGPLKRKEQVEAHLTIPTLTVTYHPALSNAAPVQIAATAPIHADYVNGVLELQRSQVKGTGTDLQFQGRIPVITKDPASLLLQGTVDLTLAQMVSTDITSSGQLRFDINSFGSTSDPNVQGRIEIVNANISTVSAPLGIQNGNGVMTLTRDRLDITSFKATVGGGELTARGGVVYRPAIQFDLALAGRGVRLLAPPGVRTNLNTDLTLTGTMEASLLQGNVAIERLSFAPDFDLSTIATSFTGESTPPPAGGFTDNMNLDIAVQSTSGVNLVSRQLSVQGAANLRVTGTANDPVILGRVNLTGGDLIFMSNRYVVQGGTIDFVNPTRTEPVVNLNVTTTINQYNINLAFQGPIDRLRTNYSSDPALPPVDIINLLAFGKTTEESAANPAAPGNMGAQSLLASGIAGQVSNKIGKIAGISQLSIDPTLGTGGAQQNPGARIAVQQRVTGNLFVTFATDVTSTQRQTVQVEYQLSPRVSITATRDQNGGFGFDTRIKKTW